MSRSGTILCSVCHQAEFRYTCPRCEAVYCSLNCYREHSAHCVEHFYKAQVEQELRGSRTDDGERRKLERIVHELSRLDAHEEEDRDPVEPGDVDDMFDEVSSIERFGTLAEKAERDTLSFEDLTEDEARRFHSELKRGALGRIVQPWIPWWERAAIVDLDSLDDVIGDACGEGMPPNHLCCSAIEGGGRRAHPSVALSVLEVVYALAHTLRAFNGDCSWDPVQAAVHLLHIASAVCSKRVFESGNVRECLCTVLASAAAFPGGGFGAALDMLCIGDTSTIILGGSLFTLRAVREAQSLVDEATSAVAMSTASNAAKVSSRFRRGSKKLDFLASFAYHHDESLAQCGAEAKRFWEERRPPEQAVIPIKMQT
eukprot:TRINITY_DN23807_c0_g1_i1.p1 TRINITY_DN23807_c0_g1~~TRINITY_DN23807_c0_g1_i1.p1  ORF type:complete len:371 (+),score=77.50 TRINITY_DN23807_c0_g1_i1:106-1218(+)